jgi:ribonuclease HII
MLRALEKIAPPPDYLLVDALTLDTDTPQRALIKGDERCRSIAAASILAKVDRDAAMREADQLYAGYGFANHKGYGTPEHLRALEHNGPTPEHRRSFAPVREVCGLPPLPANRARRAAVMSGQLGLFEETDAAPCH